MNLFVQIVTLSIRQQLTYRTSILAGLATNFFFALLRVAVMIALYGTQTEVNGLTLEGAITFVGVSQAAIAFLFLFGSWELMGSIYNGSIGSDLLRPIPFFALWMARDLGRSIVNLTLRGVLLMVLFSLLYPVQLPVGAAHWLMLLLVLSMGWMVSFCWRFLVNLSALWVPDARGIGRVAFLASGLFSGFLMPMRLYPDWFARLCMLTPFPAMYNTTVELYLGILSGAELRYALANQVFWLLALMLLAWVVMRAGIRQLVIQGG